MPRRRKLNSELEGEADGVGFPKYKEIASAIARLLICNIRARPEGQVEI